MNILPILESICANPYIIAIAITLPFKFKQQNAFPQTPQVRLFTRSFLLYASSSKRLACAVETIDTI